MKNKIDLQGPKGSQINEFWKQVVEGKITEQSFQDYLDRDLIGIPKKTSHLVFFAETEIENTFQGLNFHEYDKYFEKNNIITSVYQDSTMSWLEAKTKDTIKSKVGVYQIHTGGTIVKFLSSLNMIFSNIAFETHEQIYQFCINSTEKNFPTGSSMLFPIKTLEKDYQIVSVNKSRTESKDSYYFYWDSIEREWSRYFSKTRIAVINMKNE